MPARPRTKQQGGGGKGGKGGKKGGEERHAPPQGDRWFKPGMDEDIDDDLAFDSDDEKQFGGFFKQQARKAQQAKGGKKGGQAGDDFADDGSESFGDGDSGDFSDDSRDEIDISELLDTKEERAAAAAERRKTRDAPAANDRINIADTFDGPGKKRAAKLAARGRVMEDNETMLLAPAARRGQVSLDELAATANAALGDDAGNAKRLEALKSTSGLIGVEETEESRLRTDRRLVREKVDGDMAKWKEFVKEQRTARTVSFPLKAPNQNPVATTLTGIASVQQERIAKAAALLAQKQQEGDAADDDEPKKKAPPVSDSTKAVVSLASKMNDLLARSGLGTTAEHKRIASEGAGAAADGRPTSSEGFADQSGFLAVTGDEASGAARGDEEGGDADGPNQSYVAKLKALVGYDIAKRRRFNKIKSKAYRRILRKEKERERELKLRALELVNPDAARRKAQERLDKMRAEERATQRHKNTSKWVKHVKGIAKYDGETRDAIAEQDALRQRLMAKAAEDADDELVAAEDDISESEEEERRVDELLAGNVNATSALWGRKGRAGANDDDDVLSDPEAIDDVDGDEKAAKLRKARKQLEGMDFMQRAKERHRTQLRGDAAELQEQIERYRRGEKLTRDERLALEAAMADDDDADDDARAEMLRLAKEDRAGALDVAGLRERREKAAAAAAEARQRQREEEAARAAELRSTEAGSSRKKFGMADGDAAGRKHVDVEVGGRGGIVAGEGSARTQAERLAEARAAELEADSKRRSKRLSARQSAKASAEDAMVDDGANDEDDAIAATGAPSASTKAAAGSPKAAAADAASPGTASKKTKRVRVEAPAATSPGSKPAKAGADPTAGTAKAADLNQDYLVARAFARDDIDEDFTAAKAKQVEDAMKPEDANASLPGWGEWGGESEHLNRKHKKRVEELSLKRSIERTALASARADAKLDHAIINHDVGMVPDKHLLHIVPRPYDSAVQYERATRQPLGPEYNSVRTFQEGVAPRVETKRGVAIDPVDLSTGMHKKSELRRRKTAEAAAVDSELAEVALMPDPKERKANARAAAAEQAAVKKAAVARRAGAGKGAGKRQPKDNAPPKPRAA